MWFILGYVAGPGWSAENEYRSLRSRRRRARTKAAGLAVLAAAAALVLARSAAATAGGTWPTGGAAWEPWALRALCAVAGAAAVAAAWPGLWGRDLERWQRAAEGERRTGLLLDGLPSRGWTVRHDLRVPGARANIDHVVIGRTGVWVVDTKTTRAAVGARWRKVYFGDRPLDVESLRWEAQVVADRLARPMVGAARPGFPARRPDPGGAPGPGSGDLGGAVRAIVAVHGPGLSRPALGRRGRRVGRVRVVAAEDLVKRLRRGRRRLRRAQIRELSAALDLAFPPAAGGGRAGTGGGRDLEMLGSPMRTSRSRG